MFALFQEHHRHCNAYNLEQYHKAIFSIDDFKNSISTSHVRYKPQQDSYITIFVLEPCFVSFQHFLYQYFSYSTCFKELLGCHSASKKSQVQKSPKLILGGGQPISIKFQVQESHNHARGGGRSSPLWTVSQISPLFSLESFS